MKEKIFLSQVNPFVRNVLRGRIVPSFGCVKAYDCRLFYISGGNAKLQIENETYFLEEGTLVLFPSGIPYEFRHVQSLDMIIVNFDYVIDYIWCKKTLLPVDIGKFEPARMFRAPVFEDCIALNEPLVIRNMQRTEELLCRMDNVHRNRPLFYQEWNSGTLKSILVEIVRCYQGTQEGTQETLEKIFRFIQENLADDISARIISERFGYHENHINRLMRKTIGMTLYQYIVDRRIAKIKILLMEDGLTLAEIAEMTGFGYACNLSTCFKAKTGMSPSEFRSKHKDTNISAVRIVKEP